MDYPWTMEPTTVVIRAAQAEEAAELSEVAIRAKGHWGYDAEFLAACRAELRISPEQCDGTTLMVAELSGQLAGFYRWIPGSTDAELDALFVDPNFIGSGVGGALLRHVLQAVSNKFNALSFDADPHATPFYEHFGAQTVGSTPSASIPGRSIPRMRIILH